MKKINFKKNRCFKDSIYLVFLFIFSFLNFNLNAQDSNQQVKRLQRSIFIYNFAEQIVWTNIDESKTFNIGVLGQDRTLIDLKALSLKRKIKKKSVQVVSFNKIKDIENIQLLYVNKSFNYDIDNIISKISGQNILLITEDYNYNSSMINMVNVVNTFEYEINTGLILNAGFKYNPSLKSNAISTSQKWKELYLAIEKSLKLEKQKTTTQNEILRKEREELASKQQKITTQEVKIDTIEQQITKQNKWIKKLGNLNSLQQKIVEQKIQIESELEANIKKQIDTINKQSRIILLSKQEVEKQQKHLDNLGKKITSESKFLKETVDEINVYKKINGLLIAIISLIFIIGALIYRNYRSKMKLTKVLEQQNESIHKQTKILEFRNKELEQFAYITSHDLKEPLITISGMINLFVDEYEDKLDENGKMTLSFINESSERMRNLIDALLEYSRLGNTKEDTIIDTNTIITSLKADLSNVIARTNTTIKTKKLPTIKGSEIEIRLLFQNLISNGIKFIKTDTKPIIEIDCKKITDTTNNHKGIYQFAIKDNGIGIAEKHQERIFSIFQRLHSREEYEGTGIGLAHCKKIVEAHGGDIWLESTVGKGTTFYFTIPYIE
jgi:two-component system, chemotaxis family, sensor kinase Cph1